MGQKKNILMGPCTVETSKDGGTTWTDVGYTQDGLTMDFDPQYQDVEVDQELLPVLKKKTGQKILVQTILAENTLENYKLAMGFPDTALVTDTVGKTKTLNIGVNFDVPESQLRFVGKNPDGLDRTVTFTRVVSIGKVTTKHTKKDPKQIPIQWEVLSNDGSNYGSIVDKTL